MALSNCNPTESHSYNPKHKKKVTIQSSPSKSQKCFITGNNQY